MRARAGRSSLGCLVALLVVVVVAYFGFNVGEVYFRYYRFRDAMTQEVKFASATSDRLILTRLRAKADSLGLPEEAHAIRIRRYPRLIQISTSYSESVELPLFTRVLNFSPRVEAATATARPSR